MAKREYSVPRINAWLLFNQISRLLMEYEDEEFEEAGLTLPQFCMIATIKFLPPPVSPTDIAKFVSRTLNTIVLGLDRMEKAGLVKKKRDLPDRRKLRLSITPKGEKLFSKATIPFITVPNEIMSCLSDDELQTYIDLMLKVRETMREKLELANKTINLPSHRKEIMANIMRGDNSPTEQIID